jgi:hypothetical protein
LGIQSTEVEFIAFEAGGVLTKETWLATRMFCPRCGAGSGAVWANVSAPLTRVGNLQTRVFLCVGCKFVALGLNGFDPEWDVSNRVKQIFQNGFAVDPPEEPPSEQPNNLIVGV